MSASTPIHPSDRRTVFVGDGVLAAFSVSWPIQRLDDVAALVDGAPAAIHTVEAAGPAGARVTLVRPPDAGGRVEIIGAAPVSRVTSASQGGRIAAMRLDYEFDRLTIYAQESRSYLRREMATLRADHAAALAALRAEHSADMIAIRLEHAADVTALRFEHAHDMATLRSEMLALFGRTLRTPEPIPALPTARDRRGRALTFDGHGRPSLVDFYAVNPFLPICEAPRWTPTARVCAALVWTPDAEICAPRHVMIGGFR